MRGRIALLAVAASLAGCGGSDEEQPAAVPGSPAIPPKLVRDLRAGGHVVVFRHATTETKTDRPETIGDCATQRNLSMQGRWEARRIGETIDAVGIPVGEVRASPLCRTADTAEAMFGRVTLDRRLVSPGVIGTEAADARRVRQLRRMVDTRPEGERNTVLVTHTGNIGAAFDQESVLESGALVFRPDGDGEPDLVARIPPDAWQTLESD